MTVFENLLRRRDRRRRSAAAARPIARCIDALELCGMLRLANRPPRRSGCSTASGWSWPARWRPSPQVLLLDEIGGGLTDAEADELVETIQELRRRGIAIVWIEHIVHVLVRVVERLVCMDAGRIIADGKPEAVMRRCRRDRRLFRRHGARMSLLGVERAGCATRPAAGGARRELRDRRRARRWRWSAPTARAKPRCCAPSPAPTSPPAVASCSKAPTSPPCLRMRACAPASRWCPRADGSSPT